MNNFVITSDEVRDIHNGLCYLRNAIDRLEDTLSPFLVKELRNAKSEIEKGFKSVKKQREDVWDSKNDLFNELRDNNKFTSIWSIYEVDNIHGYCDITVEEDSVLLHQNVSVQLPAGKLTWFELWKFAEEVIVMSRDQHHVYIESFTQSSINPKIILLGTGS
jgi:hypothetical protein